MRTLSLMLSMTSKSTGALDALTTRMAALTSSGPMLQQHSKQRYHATEEASELHETSIDSSSLDRQAEATRWYQPSDKKILPRSNT